MIKSMTGYGKATGQYNHKKIQVEVRSLNSKGLDLNVKMPGIYREKEMDLRSYLSQEIVRGKAECSIYYDVVGAEKKIAFNTSLMNSYLDDLNAFASTREEIQNVNWMPILLNLPDVTQTERKELDSEEWNYVFELIKEAVASFHAFRKQEGESLEKDFQLRIGSIRSKMNEVDASKDDRVAMVKQRITNALLELQNDVSYNKERLEQEMIYYIEKLDVNEEITRLTNHLSYFETTMQETEAQGKKLGFIAQEIGREINTMGSKANHDGMQKQVVMMKDELEKIKEQVLNTL